MKRIEINNGKVKCPMHKKTVSIEECMEPCKYLRSKMLDIDITCRWK